MLIGLLRFETLLDVELMLTDNNSDPSCWDDLKMKWNLKKKILLHNMHYSRTVCLNCALKPHLWTGHVDIKTLLCRVDYVNM